MMEEDDVVFDRERLMSARSGAVNDVTTKRGEGCLSARHIKTFCLCAACFGLVSFMPLIMLCSESCWAQKHFKLNNHVENYLQDFIIQIIVDVKLIFKVRCNSVFHYKAEFCQICCKCNKYFFLIIIVYSLVCDSMSEFHTNFFLNKQVRIVFKAN